MTELIDLTLEQLRLMALIGQSAGIQSASLEEQLHLSRSTVLRQTRRLVQLGFVVRQSARNGRGIQPTYQYSLEPCFTLAAVESALTQKQAEQGLPPLEALLEFSRDQAFINLKLEQRLRQWAESRKGLV